MAVLTSITTESHNKTTSLIVGSFYYRVEDSVFEPDTGEASGSYRAETHRSLLRESTLVQASHRRIRYCPALSVVIL